VASSALQRALTEPALRPLPAPVAELLTALDAPPRLAAHLRAVHHAAWRLTGSLAEQVPGLRFDRDAVLFGAATHDIGKTVHPGELSGAGSAHEDAGQALLLQYGIPGELARFAETHARWAEPDVELEDLLVSLADKVWMGNRVPALERLVLDGIVTATGSDPWDALLRLDDIIEAVAADADRLLAYQASYPVAG
jgi:HD domain-containing protein